jgi:hypothetical protein
MGDENKLIKTGGMVFFVIMLICLSLFLVFESRNAVKKYNYIGKNLETPDIISINGSGKVTAIPNVGSVEIGVRSESKVVATAQKENTTKMNEILKAIKALGVEDKDIKTAYYNIDPKYDWSDGKSVVSGYTVSQAVVVKIRATEKTSDVLRVATEKGANNIGSLSFEIDEPEALRAEARVLAIEKAKEKAEVLAKQLGVKLGKVVSFSESQGGYPFYQNYKYSDMGLGGVAESLPAPTIQQGETEINVDVTINYEIL